MRGIGINIGKGRPVLTSAASPGGDPTEIDVNAVAFNGDNVYLLRDADFTGNVDGVKGSFVAWVKITGDEGSSHTILSSTGTRVRITRESTGKIRIRMRDSTPTLILDLLSTNVVNIAAGWTCVLASWDMSASPLANLYFADVDEKNETVKIAGTVEYAVADYSVGATVTGTIDLTGCLAQFYFNPKEYIDFSIESNRRKFISAGGKPVEMGDNGEDPTGTDPILFLSGDTDVWHTNLGTGGGMTVTGVLTQCPDSPGDPPEITVNAVNLDGTNDYLTRDADLTGSVDGDFITASFWLNLAADDATAYVYLNTSDQGIEINKGGGNRLAVLLGNAVGNAWIASPTRTLLVSDGWLHVLLSLDTSGDGSNRRMYINNVRVTDWVTDAYVAGRSVDWTKPDHFIGANLAAASKLNGDLAELWLTNEFIDLSVQANRRKFISAGGKPVGLGSDGSLPTGTAAKVFFEGATVSWHTNDGDGGGFTENGALTDAATSPSD